MYILLLLSLGFSQFVQHKSIESSLSNQSIKFDIFVDNNNKSIDSAVLMYKNVNQAEYLSEKMIHRGNNNFSCTIDEYFSNKLDLEYFFLIEFQDGGVVSHPVQDSYLIDIIPHEDDYWENIDANEEVDLLVLSPMPNSKLDKDNLVIAVSMFSIPHVDPDNIKVTINDKDITDSAIIKNNFLSISNLKLDSGEYLVSIFITNKFGIKYKPYSWNFEVKKSADKSWINKKNNQKLKYWCSYLASNINENNIEYYDHNIAYNIDFSWMNFKSNFKISSLEDPYIQAKDRYSIKLRNDDLELDLGDFNPYFNSYILNGSRVRGVNFNLRNNMLFENLSLSINFIKGELNRAIQGPPDGNSVYISEIDTLNKVLTINRENYSFKRELYALKLGLGLKKKMFWYFNIFKAKDNINSVLSVIPNSKIEINDDYISDANSTYLKTMITDSTYLVSYDDLMLHYNSFIYEVDSINYLKENWGGEKPKDNLIIGSELLFNLDDGKTIIHSEFNLSMLNQNLWNSITEVSQLDTLGSDTLQDGLFMDYPLSEAEKILEYKDIFELGFDQTPYFPYEPNSNNILKAIFNMPSAIYKLGSKFNYGNHSIEYMYEKIGSEFHSLGNLYNQTDISKTSISDRMRFFENRMYIYIDYTKQKEGLSLFGSNSLQTNIGTFNLSLYPGANLPNINIGFSNQNRSNNLSDAYFSEDSTIILDTREHMYTNNYNISISDKILLIKEHSINFSIFVSEKKDMLFNEKILLDSSYYSPRSYNSNVSLGILTPLNSNWKSNIIYNNSSYNNGNKVFDVLNYYQEQNISSIDLSLRYSGESLLDKIKFGFNMVNGTGYQNFIYYNFKLLANHKLLSNLQVLWNYDYQLKWIENDDFYNDSIIRMKLIFNL